MSALRWARGLWPAARVPHWVEPLNLAGPRARTASWAWVLLLAGLTTATWVGLAAEQAEGEWQQAQADVQRLQRARHQQGLALQARDQVPARGGEAGGAMSPLSADGAAHAAQLLRWLTYPWVATLREADEAAVRAHVQMLGFSLDLQAWNGQPQNLAWVRMSAAVQDDAAALRWAQALGPQAHLLSRERLGAPVDSALGNLAARAELTWPGAQP
ncbi:MAG: hypothetical protein RI907_1989 [Pseudomonadota bacterium]